MRIQQLRNATVLVTLGPHILLVDPLLGPPGSQPGFRLLGRTPGAPRRRNPLVPLPPAAGEALGSATAVLVTHEHPDHLDRPGLDWIRTGTLPVWAAPVDAPSLASKLPGSRVRELGAGAPGISVEVIPGRHGRGLVGWLMGPVSGFYLACPGEPSLYLTGDTVLTEEVREALVRLRPDVVLAPAGSANFGFGSDILFSLDELVELVRLSPGLVVLNHLEALDHCPATRAATRARMDAEGLGERVRIPEDGETLVFSVSTTSGAPEDDPTSGRAPVRPRGEPRRPGLQKRLTSLFAFS